MQTVDGSGEDVPGHRPIEDTDLEISYNMSGKDLVLRVNKAGIMVFRVLLKDAAIEQTSETLFRFSTVVPDFVFKIPLDECADYLSGDIPWLLAQARKHAMGMPNMDDGLRRTGVASGQGYAESTTFGGTDGHGVSTSIAVSESESE
jgi:hypothetical protein